ncbi:hypothetical protein [uncultured Ruminococcus sp.]
MTAWGRHSGESLSDILRRLLLVKGAVTFGD